ncbi:hypothetical protein [Streptomyces albus]|uniref:hypothetical protein n=1 Tax=Streptomyces albus TaxID=1888 RepID=UPI0006E380B2|nr:hypothetical protein [Streptomyces albus]
MPRHHASPDSVTRHRRSPRDGTTWHSFITSRRRWHSVPRHFTPRAGTTWHGITQKRATWHGISRDCPA